MELVKLRSKSILGQFVPGRPTKEWKVSEANKLFTRGKVLHFDAVILMMKSNWQPEQCVYSVWVTAMN